MNDPCGRCQYSPTMAVLASYTIRLPMAAVSQNQLSGRTSMVSRRLYTTLRNKYQRLIAPAVTGIPAARHKRRVTLTRIYRKGRRQLDDDNLIAGFKGARDVLTRLGLLVDDTSEFLEAHYSQRPGEDDAVEIVIEDLAWP